VSSDTVRTPRTRTVMNHDISPVYNKLVKILGYNCMTVPIIIYDIEIGPYIADSVMSLDHHVIMSAH